MNISKKWLSTSVAAVLFATLLTGCSEEKKSPDQAIKDAYPQLWTESYNYAGNLTANVNMDENALIGTKGGLTEEEAEQELELLEELQSRDGQQALAMIKNGKFTFHGAYDGKNLKSDIVLGINADMNGMKLSFDIPILIDMKSEIALYVDPKAAKAFAPMPPQIDGKLIKMTLNDIPTITAEQKAKFNDGSAWVKKFEDISNASIKNLDAAMFKDIDVSAAAKAAGATRSVQVTITPEQSAKLSADMVNQLLDTMGPDFGLSAEDIAEAKAEYAASNKNMKLFMGNAVTEYGLDKDGKIVYMSSYQTFKGAKHVGDMKAELTLKDFGKPAFTVDPSKQGSISVTELMMTMM